jgi:5-methylthioadenosine/S-adenosylhomocysteine deaminase
MEAPGFSVSQYAELVSANDRLLIPGLVNSHTHSHGALNRGAVEDRVSLEMFLTERGASPRSRGIEEKYLSAALSAVEMIFSTARRSLPFPCGLSANVALARPSRSTRPNC